MTDPHRDPTRTEDVEERWRKDVREMRRAYTESEVTYSDLSERFGVSTSTVGRIIKQESWSHV